MYLEGLGSSNEKDKLHQRDSSDSEETNSTDDVNFRNECMPKRTLLPHRCHSTLWKRQSEAHSAVWDVLSDAYGSKCRGKDEHWADVFNGDERGTEIGLFVLNNRADL